MEEVMLATTVVSVAGVGCVESLRIDLHLENGQ
jgi:hypothetical protein